MLVEDLIQKLLYLPPDLEVLVPGYEGGFSPIKDVRQDTLLTDVNSEWYYGPHDVINSVADPENYAKKDFIILFK